MKNIGGLSNNIFWSMSTKLYRRVVHNILRSMSIKLYFGGLSNIYIYLIFGECPMSFTNKNILF